MGTAYEKGAARFRSGRAWWAWAGVALAAAAAAAQAGEPETAAVAVDAAARPFCWQIERGGVTSHLLGSLHVAKPEIYPLAVAIEDAFAEAEVLVVEADPAAAEDPGFVGQILGRALDVEDRPLASGLSEEAVAELQEAIKTHKLKMVVLERFEPWYVAQMISLLEMQRLGVDLKSGIDLHFIDRARDRKPIVELEGAAFQLEFFDGFTDKEQSLMLEYTLRDLENLGSMMGDLTLAWEQGDADRMDALLHGYLKDSEGLEAAFERIFGRRNREMVEKIRALLATGKRYFIIVGAGHLVGEDGLLELLADEETRIRQL